MKIISTISEIEIGVRPGDAAYILKDNKYLCFLDSSLYPNKYSKFSYLAWEPSIALISNGFDNLFLNLEKNITVRSYQHPLIFFKKEISSLILENFQTDINGNKKLIKYFLDAKNEKLLNVDDGKIINSGAKKTINSSRERGSKEGGIAGLPDFMGGFIGYFSYDLKNYIENLPENALNDQNFPLIYMLYFKKLLAFRHMDSRWFLVRNYFLAGNLQVGNLQDEDIKVEKLQNGSRQFENSHAKNENSTNYNAGDNEDLNFYKDNFEEYDFIDEKSIDSQLVEKIKTESAEIKKNFHDSIFSKSSINCGSNNSGTTGDSSFYNGNGIADTGCKSIIESIIKKYSAKNIRKINLKPNMSRFSYLDKIKKVKKHIFVGDIYQVNYSQRFEADLPVEDMDLYYILREKNPASFSAYLKFPEFTIGSSSPERFLFLKYDDIETRPIKGTRPRGKNKKEEEENKKELSESSKDRAELNMIVDLERNDLGKFCYYGSVQVTEHAVIEEFAKVLHSVSTVTGKVKDGTLISDILKAAFPGGSITGAPKIRAMEIIDELEPNTRNIYTGSLGYIGIDRTMDLNIVIRTFVIKGNKFYYNVGGGIVADSIPSSEYLETLDKGLALEESLKFFTGRNLKNLLNQSAAYTIKDKRKE